MVTFNDLADEVAGLMKHENYDFRRACREVLEGHAITENWDYYFPRIGQILGTRRKPKTMVKKKAQPPFRSMIPARALPKPRTDFNDGLSLKEIRQKLADSDS